MDEQIRTLESMRKRVLHADIAVFAIAVGGFIFSIFSLHLFLMFPAIILAILAYFLLVRKKSKEYKDYYKNVFVRGMIRQVIPDAEYEPGKGFPRELIRETGLMLMGNIYSSEDYIRGSYNNVSFERADILIQDESTDSDGNTTTTTYLRGRWMIFESNKNFEADLQLIQKGFGYANKRRGLFTKKADRRHEFKTEDEAFNKTFQCLCQNESEAFYLLTPGVMQGLLRLASQTDGKIMVGFVDNRLHVAVNSKKDSLEPPVFRSFNNGDFDEVRNEINAITGFVESVNLDRKIFK